VKTRSGVNIVADTQKTTLDRYSLIARSRY